MSERGRSDRARDRGARATGAGGSRGARSETAATARRKARRSRRGGGPGTTGRTFTYEEALALFPVVRDLTTTAVRQVEALINQVQSREEAQSRKSELRDSYDRIVAAWAEEVASLGCEVKGLWLVDWDSGDGYFCWRFPEQSLGHFHGYDEGFEGRVPIN